MLHEIRRQSIYSVIYKRQYDATKAIRAMDASHLAKPIDLNTLLKTLSELLS